MSRAGNVWDNSAMESFFSTLKTERTANKVYRTRNEARADVFDYIERFYNPRRRHSKLGYISLLSPAYLLSVERWPFHSEPPDHYDLLSHLLAPSRSQSSWLMPLH